MRKQQGFTLIELIVVIIILGILSATALPKFIDLGGDAESAAVEGVAGAVSSWGMSNYAAKKMGKQGSDVVAVAATTTDTACNAITSATINGVELTTSALAAADADTKYQVTNVTGKSTCSSGATIQCTLISKNSKTAIAYIPCTN